MKTITKYTVASVLLAAVLLIGSGCSSDTPGMTKAESDRMAALEAEIKALRIESQAREKALKEELASVRKSLDAIHDLIDLDQKRADATKQPETRGDKLDQEIDEKAKSFVNENLQKLMDITKKLLDKMEKEIDEQMTKQPPVPEGDQI